MKRNKKYNKSVIITVCIAAFCVIAAIAAIVINLFVPLKYLSAYLIFSKDVNDGAMRITFIDVGYGDSTLLEFPDGKTALIDGGNGLRTNNLKVFKTLNCRGIDKIDFLICTSVSAERCGGLAEILKYKSVGKIFMPFCGFTQINSSYRSFCETVAESGCATAYCEYGEAVVSDGYKLCFLSPSAHDYSGGEYENLNNEPSAKNVYDASAVLWLDCEGVQILFCGDVTETVFEKIYNAHIGLGGLDINGYTVNLQDCDVIKVAGHGASSSVYTPIYDLTKPQTAIISVGENGNGCPSTKALSSVQNFVADKLYRTDLNGTVSIVAKAGAYSVFKEK